MYKLINDDNMNFEFQGEAEIDYQMNFNDLTYLEANEKT